MKFLRIVTSLRLMSRLSLFTVCLCDYFNLTVMFRFILAINYCDKDPSLCSENEECQKGPDDNPKAVSCLCKPGYERNEQNICTFVLCESGNNHCSEFEKCSEDKDGDKLYLCDCVLPYSLKTNETSCVLKDGVSCTNNKTKCGNGGECKLFEGKETCICKKGYEEEGGTCVEYCQSKKWKDNPSSTAICPTGKCELTDERRIKCVCEPSSKWEQADDGISCKLKPLCDKGEVGEKECSSRSAKCEVSRNYEKGYQCRCPEGTEVDTNGKCKSLCDFEKYIQTCKNHYADCVVVDGKATCECKPSFLDYDGKPCKYANVTYAVSLRLPNLELARVKREAVVTSYSDPGIHRSKLKKVVDDAVRK
ncbi:protein kinase C-binding protein NELL2-like [Limulus polyphemus]|uniref:Protein kinase C-binding protein NELL2-like n=1 Tax=Limulus polyphemus TaxID=6850 RepID=A0ABM1RZR1_LIMPO|nr:protein kinase C-binding protein NELL2-like [Limulus polyphemus]